MKITITIFGKMIKEMSKDEKRAYCKYLYDKKPKSNNYKNTRCWKLFGKRWKDLNKEEMRQLKNYEYQHSHRYKYKAENSFAQKHFGKRHKDMTKEEQREYTRLRKAIYRDRVKKGISVGRGYYIKGE